MSDFPSQQRLIAALLDPQHSPLGPGRVRLIETHISWVLLAGRFAYKIKKAVNLDFLDFTALASRRHYCQEELRINRRMAAQLYLDVIPIGGTPAHPLPGQEPAIEYAVRMRRFPAGQLLATLLPKGRVTPQHMEALAHTVAAFHEALPPAAPAAPYGTPAGIRAAAMQNFDQIAGLLPDGVDQAEIAHVRGLTETACGALAADFTARRAQGFVRECHGDLHLGNVVLIGDDPVPFDGIEFSADLRWGDVMSETAFLMMDLLYHDEGALAFRFLNAYLDAGGDHPGLATLPFYLAYRAMVRAKISAIRAAQPDLPTRAHRRELAAARRHLALARAFLETRRGALIITHGLPGSGKTTFAQLALEQLGAIRIRSDVERKRLFGLAPQADSRASVDIYTADATRRTYARLHELARIALAAGFPVIVDAAFLRHAERSRFRELAAALDVPFAIASLQAPADVLRSRVAQRQARADDASEAGVQVLAMLQQVQEPLDDAERDRCAAFQTRPGAADLRTSPGWARLYALLGLHA